MSESYRNEEWLYRQYITLNKSSNTIAKELGVGPHRVKYHIKKFGIVKSEEAERQTRIEGLMRDRKTLECDTCGKEFSIRSRLYLNKLNSGQTKFFCGRKCSGVNISKIKTGKPIENHPSSEDHPDHLNYIEKLRENALNSIEKYKQDGSWEWRLQRLHTGHAEFIQTDAGAEVLRKAGIKAVKSQKGRKSSIERIMEEELQRRGVQFEEQFVIAGRYIADFYLPKYNAIIECDGDYWHNLPDVRERDKRKNKAILSEGYSLHRFWEHAIKEDVKKCLDEVINEKQRKEA